MGPMADWLCRLSPEEWALSQWSAEAAKALGVDAWVISVEAEGVAPQQAGLLGEMLESPDGLPVALEWCLSEHSGLASLQQKLDGIGPWLQHPRAYRIAGRSLLLIRGTEHLRSEPSVAERLQQLFREQGCDSLPWLVPCCSSSVDGFDGVYEEVLLPERSSQPSSRANYELHLRNAHWHESPHGWHIPAVRALAANDWDCYRNATAKRYRDWLRLVSHWSVLQRNGDLRSPVLLESWSGHCRWWSDDGEVKLIADSSSEPITSTVQKLAWGECSAENLALMVHGYYIDVLASMLHRLDPRAQPSIDLYVSTPIRQLHAVANVLRRQGWPRVHLFGVPNRGRDIAPFLLHLLPAVHAHGHLGFLKLHTKSSPHLSDGEDWGQHLLNSLLDPGLLQGLVEQLQQDPNLGLLAPAGTLVPITLQLQNNGDHLLQLQRRRGIRGLDLLGSDFIAGSMFAGRVSVLEPLLKLGLQLSDFEPEAAQTDGTLAHGLERWIGVQAHQLGLRIEELAGDPRSMPGFGYRWSCNQVEPQTAIHMGSAQTASVRDLPLIDSPLFSAHRREGLFGDQLAVADQLHHQGYAVIDLGRERMQTLATRIRADLDGAFDLEAWRCQGGHRNLRVQDAWQQSDAVRELALMPEIEAVLQRCWGRQPFAFQTLNFPVGTQQDLHSDAVHFHSEPPGFMCGVWVALEDIHPESGPLEYVPGSQRLPYLQAVDVGVRQQPGVTPDQKIFHDYWQMVLSQGDFERQRFTSRLGQALIWSANLIHGGSAVDNLQLTRWSQVTHYFFDGCRHYTPMLSDWPDGPVAWRNPFDIARGCERVLEPEAPSGVLASVQALASSHGWSLQKLDGLAVSSVGMEQALLEEAIASREAGAAAFSLALMEWATEAGFTSPWLQVNRARALVHLQRLKEACELWRELAEPHQTAALQSAAREMLHLHGLQPQLEEALSSGDLSAADQVLDPLLEQGQDNGPLEWQPFVASLDQQGLMPWLLPLLEARLDSNPSEGVLRLIDSLRLLRGDAHLDRLVRSSQDQILAFGWRAAAGAPVLLGRTNTGRWIQARSTGPNLRRPDVAEQLQLPALSDAGFLAVLALEPGESLTGLWLQGHPQSLDVRDLRGLPYIGVVDQLLQLCQAGLTPLERAPALFEAGIGRALQDLAAPLNVQEHWQGLIQRREHFGVVMRDAEITVVIPLYRRWDFMLGHVAGFCQDPWFQEQRVRLFYVIDDPTIETEVLGWCRSQLTDELLDVTVISLQRNSGFALACNSGVLAAETPMICLLNSDVLPINPGWLQPLLRTLLLEPDAVVAPLLLSDEGRIQHAGMTVQPVGIQGLPACVHPLKGLDPAQLKTLSPDGLPYDVELLSGAALMFERKSFLELGGFDPVFGRGDFEDLDFSLRWRRSGGKLKLVPSARLTHLERQSIGHDVDPMVRWRGLLNAWQAKSLCAEELA